MENNIYKTKDLAEASFLLAKGKQLLILEREERTCWFVFHGLKECEKLVSSFWFGDSTIQAKSFYDAIQVLKNKIFA